ncbi:SMR/MUTS family protein [Blastochloris viridis]|uniref:SMR/MUTS family protein n=1 Tax=Blastochloris viridis TaxID=1079 RepID=A0A182D1X0_BLAVI|nr:SMR/MUTS family protein [Blastochloris viridis]
MWEHVIREIRPLRGRKPRPKKDVKSGSEPAAPGAEVELAGKPPVAKLAKAPGKTATPRPPAGPPPLAPIERRTRLRLVRGVVEIDARIDLHGLTRHEAHGRLTRFLIQAQGHGARIVLVITGKGAPAGWGPERGVLRREVPLWLEAAELRPLVVGFETAHVLHGGEGALYVRVRRRRE